MFMAFSICVAKRVCIGGDVGIVMHQSFCYVPGSGWVIENRCQEGLIS